MISVETKHICASSITWFFVRALLALLNIALLMPFTKGRLAHFRGSIKSLEIKKGEDVKALRVLKTCECISDKTRTIKSGDIVAFIRKVPSTSMFDDFFNYYRELGVNHFILLGCRSDLPDLAGLKKHLDISVWIAAENQPRWINKEGIHALNGLLAIYGTGHWCFILDSDEYFVYPKMDTRSLRELLAYLDQEGKAGFITVTIDMFGNGALGDPAPQPSEGARFNYRWFDPDGIVQWWDSKRRAWLIVGGARRRLLFAKNPRSSPLINRVPLVKWRPKYMITRQAVMLRPLKLNNPGFGDRITPTGCLLQYRFCNAAKAGILMEMEGRSHCDEHARLAAEACDKLTLEEVLWHKEATEYEGGWRQFARLGLMNIGTWF